MCVGRGTSTSEGELTIQAEVFFEEGAAERGERGGDRLFMRRGNQEEEGTVQPQGKMWPSPVQTTQEKAPRRICAFVDFNGPQTVLCSALVATGIHER